MTKTAHVTVVPPEAAAVEHTLRELQSILARLDRARYDHEQWYRNLVRTLVARTAVCVADLQADAHQRCRFSHWYSSDATSALRHHPSFKSLARAHQAMHDRARHLLQRMVQGHAIAPAELDEFHHRVDRMRLALATLRRELADALHERDPLTGARNRGHMLSDLREQLALVRRGVEACTITIIDLDHFKDVNDRHGHLAGDAVLVATARCLEAHVRPYDRLYRYGGEEFLLCMAGTEIDGALTLAERLRCAIAGAEIHEAGDGTVLRVTASMGVAGLAASRSVEESIEEADRALYRAKARGRNRVEAEGEGGPGTR